MKRRLTMFLACFFLILGEVLAQTKVTGTVVAAEDGEPVIGASVIVQGQRSGTVTDEFHWYGTGNRYAQERYAHCVAEQCDSGRGGSHWYAES